MLDRSGGDAGQGGAAQERAPVEAGSIGLLVVVVQTLYRFVSLVGIDICVLLSTDFGACRAPNCDVGHYLLASPDRQSSSREREYRRFAAENPQSPTRRRRAGAERRVRLRRRPDRARALALRGIPSAACPTDVNGRGHHRPTSEPAVSPAAGGWTFRGGAALRPAALARRTKEDGRALILFTRTAPTEPPA